MATTSTAATAGRWSWSAARPTNPLFGAFFEAVQQAGYPITDDVNGYQQEGFAKFDRNVRRGRRLSAARAYLHPVMHRKNLDGHDAGAGASRAVRRHAGDRRRVQHAARRHAAGRRRRGHPVRRRVQLAAAAAAQRASATPTTSVRSASPSSTTCRRSASTCRTTSRSTCSTRASSRSRCSRS